jgi:hypothetical protein
MGGLLMAGLLTIQITDRKSNVVKSRDLQWHDQSHPAAGVFVCWLPLEKVVGIQIPRSIIPIKKITPFQRSQGEC